MSRVNLIDPNTASGEARELLDAVQAQLGATPAFIRVLANSPAAEVDALRAAGYDDAGIVDIIVAVSLNVLTNFLGKATRVEIDFPRVALDRAA